ncbi:MAG: hypothetical protein HOF84_03095, partial [Rhodospirillales bacterium]|nr:hypothetical protein [Rhodospirillales bacterium]
VTTTTKAAKGIVTAPAVPKPSGGFISNVWDSMTGWVPFTGDKDAPKASPEDPQTKQAQPSRPTQVTPAPLPKKVPEPVSKAVKEAPAKTAKETTPKAVKEPSAKPEKGFFSSAWDSMTGWVPFTDDKKDGTKKGLPKDPRLPLSSDRSSEAPAEEEVATNRSTTSDEPQHKTNDHNINDEVETRARAFAKARKQKDAEQKVRQEKAAAAAKQRAEAELAPPAKTESKPTPEPKIDPVAEQEQAAAEFKQKVEQRRQVAARQKNRIPLDSKSTSEPTPEPKQIPEGSSPKEPKKNFKKETSEEAESITPPSEQSETKQSVFAKIGHYFKRRWNKNLKDRPKTETAKVNPTVKVETPEVQPPEKKPPEENPSENQTSVNEFPENGSPENSASYANLPLPEPPPPIQAISISQNVNLVVGTANNLGQELNIELVEDNKCVEKTEQNILFCLERVVWPDPIRKTLKSPLSLMGDDMAMIRYDGGKASQIHINFPTDTFDKLINYFEKKYGPPTEYPKILMHRIGAPAENNPTVRWRVANPAMGRDVILEVRKTDDLRSILPADGAGVIRLYSSGDQMIFRYVSTADIMLMRMKYSTTRRKKRPRKAR